MRSKPRSSTSSSFSAWSATGAGDDALGAHLGEVAHAAQQPVGDARRAARAARDLVARRSASIGTSSIRAERRTISASSSTLVEVEPQADAEAVAQRRR